MAPELKSLVRLLLLAVVWELSAQGATERQINPEVRNEAGGEGGGRHRIKPDKQIQRVGIKPEKYMQNRSLKPDK